MWFSVQFYQIFNNNNKKNHDHTNNDNDDDDDSSMFSVQLDQVSGTNNLIHSFYAFVTYIKNLYLYCLQFCPKLRFYLK